MPLIDDLPHPARAIRRRRQLAKAEHFYRQGDFEKAVETLKRLVDLEPSNWKLLSRLAWLYERNNQYQQAIDLYRSAEQFAPGQVLIKWYIGHTLIFMGHYAEALPYLEECNQRRGPNSQILAYIGMALLQLGKHKEAEDALREGMRLNKRNPDIWIIMVELYLVTDRKHLIIDLLKQNLRLSPKKATSHVFMADHLHYRLENPQGSLPYYQRGLERALRPKQIKNNWRYFSTYSYPATIVDGYVSAYIKSSHKELAEKIAKEDLERNPGQAYAMSRFSYFLELKGQRAEAISLLEQALQLDPLLDQANLYLGYLHLVERCYAEAEQHTRSALELMMEDDDQFVVAMATLSVALTEQGKQEEAQEILKGALQRDAKITWASLADVHAKLGQWSAVIHDCRQALALNPDEVYAWWNLAKASQELDQHEEALQAYQELLRREPEDGETWIELGKLYLKLGRQEGARSALEHVLSGKSSEEEQQQAKELLEGLSATTM